MLLGQAIYSETVRAYFLLLWLAACRFCAMHGHRLLIRSTVNSYGDERQPPICSAIRLQRTPHGSSNRTGIG